MHFDRSRLSATLNSQGRTFICMENQLVVKSN